MTLTSTFTKAEPFFFDPSYLEQRLAATQEQYKLGQPFPHIVMDDFLPPEVLDRILEEFPAPGGIRWNRYTNDREVKLESSSELNMGPNTRLLLRELNSSVFLYFLESLTGIEGIIPDPHYNGGGLHQIQRGGFLKVHTDFNRQSHLKLDRRLNLLIYLNKEWEESYGGHFELWNRDMTRCEKKILPIFNRCVIFSTTDYSYHGHPDALTCPEGWTRKSLAMYYYTNGRPEHEVSGEHTTVFKARPGERFSNDNQVTWKSVLRKVVPPVIYDIKRALTR